MYSFLKSKVDRVEQYLFTHSKIFTGHKILSCGPQVALACFRPLRHRSSALIYARYHQCNSTCK